MDKKDSKTNTQKVIAKAKKRGWKTVIGIGLNAAGAALVANPNIYILIAGVACLGIGSALLAWDDGEEKKIVKNKEVENDSKSISN